MSGILRSLATAALATGLLQMLTPAVHGQIGANRIQRPFNRPTVTPYLNLVGGLGNGGASVVNYYGVVRPQQQATIQTNEFRRQFEQLSSRPVTPNPQQRRFGSLRQQPRVTGHATSFETLAGAAPQGAGGSAPGGFSVSGFGAGEIGADGFSENSTRNIINYPRRRISTSGHNVTFGNLGDAGGLNSDVSSPGANTFGF